MLSSGSYRAFLLISAGMLASNLYADWACARNRANTGCVDVNGQCAAAGGRCFMVVVNGQLTDCFCGKTVGGLPQRIPPPKPNTQSSGKGKADPLTFPKSPFTFSKSSFTPGTFSYDKILMTDFGDLSLMLRDFTTTMDFFDTSNPLVRDVVFSSFDWTFDPFTIPGTNIADVERVQLNPAASVLDGSLDLGTGTLTASVPAEWLDTSNRVVALSVESYSVTITEESPTVDNVAITDVSSLVIVPERSTFGVIAGLLAAFAIRRIR